MTRPRDAQLPLLLTMSEGLSRGPDEMVPVSPNDSMHPPSCGLAIRDAVEEIKWLRAEVERLREALEEWDALIVHQFHGTRDAMSDMQRAALNTKKILDGLDALDGLEAKP